MEEYKEFRKEQNKSQKKFLKKNPNYHKEIVKCDKCGIQIKKGSLFNHKKSFKCRKMWDSSLLNSDSEE